MDPERVRNTMEKLAQISNEMAEKAKEADCTVNPPLTREDYRKFRNQSNQIFLVIMRNSRVRESDMTRRIYRRQKIHGRN